MSTLKAKIIDKSDWIIASVIGILGLLALDAFDLRSVVWKAYQSKNDSFSIEFPQRWFGVRDDTLVSGDDFATMLNRHSFSDGTAFGRHEMVFDIVVIRNQTDLDKKPENASAILDSMTSARTTMGVMIKMKYHDKGKFVKEESIVLHKQKDNENNDSYTVKTGDEITLESFNSSDFPGVDFTVQVDGYEKDIRVIYKGTRIYMMEVRHDLGLTNRDPVTKFFNSFKFI